MRLLNRQRTLELLWLGWTGLRSRRDERGDVPGWVMIVVMTAGLVVALTAVAGGRLESMLESALASVGG